MKRYKVRKINDTILHEMPFPDLLIKYTTGLTLMLKVKEGDYLPIEILEQSDLQRSLIVGSLGAYIKAGKIIVEDDEPKVIEKPKPEPSLSKPVQVSQPKPQEHSVEGQAPKQEIKPQPQVENKPADTPQPIQDLAQVKTVEDFGKLSYFLRTKFVATCTDKTLLSSIEKIADRQIKVNIINRLAVLNQK